MRQILYVSLSNVRGDQAALDRIVNQSRHNNALDGVTGLLWSDGERFAQVIEGDPRAIEDAMTRIRADDRHRDIVVLHDIDVTERQFGSWSMDLRDATGAADDFDERMRALLESAALVVPPAFAALVPTA